MTPIRILECIDFQSGLEMQEASSVMEISEEGVLIATEEKEEDKSFLR